MENRSTHLSTWVSADLKERFATAAVLQGLSESALLKRPVEQMLAGAGSEFGKVERPTPIARDARVTVRLVPDDSLRLRERAAARGMPAATYVSSLVRARLQRIIQAARSGKIGSEPGATNLQETRRAVVQGWHAVAGRALDEGLPQLAQDIWKLIGGMQPPRSDDERLRSKLAARVDGDRRRGRDAPGL
jgi:hypothetical protein